MGGQNLFFILLNRTPLKSGSNQVSFLFLRGVTLGPLKIWAPMKAQTIFVFLFFHFARIGPFKNSGANPMTFPFLEGVTLGP